MFIRKKEYEKKIDSYEKKLDLLEHYYVDECVRLYEEKYKVEVERDNLKGLVDTLENRIKMLEDQARNDGRTRYITWKEHKEKLESDANEGK